MITLIRKKFIKDYQNVKKKEVRNAHGKMAGIIGIISNFFLFGIKLFAGIISGSISIIADSINNLSDMGSSIITLIGFKLSNKPADKEHPFGHERIEYIVGLIVSIIILFVGGQFLYTSILKIINKSDIKINYISLIILGVSIFIKLWQSLMYKKVGKIIDSVSLQATSIDSRNDCISTLVVLLGCGIFLLFDINVDGYFGVLVSLFIIYSGIELIKETASPLIGQSLDKETVELIISEIKKYEYVLGVHDVVCHSYGPTKKFMSIHAEVPAKENILILHDQIDIIESEISSKYDIELIIHMDPIENDNEEVLKLKEQFIGYLTEISPQLHLHDFRMVDRRSCKNIIFDIVIPYNFNIKNEDILNILEERIKEEGEYNLVINFDNDYN